MGLIGLLPYWWDHVRQFTGTQPFRCQAIGYIILTHNVGITLTLTSSGPFTKCSEIFCGKCGQFGRDVVISRQATKVCAKRVDTCNMRCYRAFRNCVIVLSWITCFSRTNTNVDINKDPKGFVLSDMLVNEVTVHNYNNTVNYFSLFSMASMKRAT